MSKLKKLKKHKTKKKYFLGYCLGEDLGNCSTCEDRENCKQLNESVTKS